MPDDGTRTPQERLVSYELCEECNGSGESGDWYCRLCGGTGMVSDDIDADGPEEWDGDE